MREVTKVWNGEPKRGRNETLNLDDGIKSDGQSDCKGVGNEPTALKEEISKGVLPDCTYYRGHKNV